VLESQRRRAVAALKMKLVSALRRFGTPLPQKSVRRLGTKPHAQRAKRPKFNAVSFGAVIALHTSRPITLYLPSAG